MICPSSAWSFELVAAAYRFERHFHVTAIESLDKKAREQYVIEKSTVAVMKTFLGGLFKMYSSPNAVDHEVLKKYIKYVSTAFIFADFTGNALERFCTPSADFATLAVQIVVEMRRLADAILRNQNYVHLTTLFGSLLESYILNYDLWSQSETDFYVRTIVYSVICFEASTRKCHRFLADTKGYTLEEQNVLREKIKYNKSKVIALRKEGTRLRGESVFDDVPNQVESEEWIDIVNTTNFQSDDFTDYHLAHELVVNPHFEFRALEMIAMDEMQPNTPVYLPNPVKQFHYKCMKDDLKMNPPRIYRLWYLVDEFNNILKTFGFSIHVPLNQAFCEYLKLAQTLTEQVQVVLKMKQLTQFVLLPQIPEDGFDSIDSFVDWMSTMADCMDYIRIRLLNMVISGMRPRVVLEGYEWLTSLLQKELAGFDRQSLGFGNTFAWLQYDKLDKNNIMSVVREKMMDMLDLDNALPDAWPETLLYDRNRFTFWRKSIHYWFEATAILNFVRDLVGDRDPGSILNMVKRLLAQDGPNACAVGYSTCQLNVCQKVDSVLCSKLKSITKQRLYLAVSTMNPDTRALRIALVQYVQGKSESFPIDANVFKQQLDEIKDMFERVVGIQEHVYKAYYTSLVGNDSEDILKLF